MSRKKGKHSLENYIIFEAIREKVWGGSIIGVHESLNPHLITIYKEDFELILVETKVGNKEIRFITGYGPQENWDESEKLPFFIALDQEVMKAQMEGKAVFVYMDANSKLGQGYIPKDLHQMSKNGEVLCEIIEKNALIVANGLSKICRGTITRERTIDGGNKERSTIDFVLVSQDLEEYIDSVIVDEEGVNVLSKVNKSKHGVVTKSGADHNITDTDLNVKWNRSLPKDKVKIYNLKNKLCQEKFKDHTNKTEMAKIFESSKDINILTKKFVKHLNGCIKECFTKKTETQRVETVNYSSYMKNYTYFRIKKKTQK